MTCYPRAFTLSEIEDRSDIVLEGEIEFIYRSYVPSLLPRQIGHHVLFNKKSLKLVKSSVTGGLIFQSFPDIGFWSLDFGCDVLTEGDLIRISLVQDLNCSTALVLMPFPAINTIVNLKTNRCVSLRSTPTLCKLTSPSLVLQLGIFPPPIGSDMFDWHPSLSKAAKLWNAVGSVMQIQLIAESGQGPNPLVNLIPTFVDSISPRNPGADEPLARATLCPQSPQNGSIFLMNRKYSWSAAISPPAGTFHFPSIAAHELGHALGFDHSTDPKSLMYPAIAEQEVKVPNADDATALKSSYG